MQLLATLISKIDELKNDELASNSTSTIDSHKDSQCNLWVKRAYLLNMLNLIKKDLL